MPDCDAWEYLACPRHRDEQPRAVADDLGEAALVLVPVEAIGREPGQFKALFAAYQRALNGEWIVACEAQRFAAGKDKVADLLSRWSGNSGEAKGLGDRSEIDIEHFAPDDRLAVLGNEPGDADMIAGQALSDRQQQPGGEMDALGHR